MRLFLAAALIVVPAVPGFSQYRGGGAGRPPSFTPPVISPQRAAPPITVPSAGALGGSFASIGISRPLGGIAPPTFPAGVPQRRRNPVPATGYRYVGPIYYVPGPSDYPLSAPEPAPIAGGVAWQPPAAAAPPQPPIIINQYFSSAPDRNTASYEPAPEPAPAANSGDPIGVPSNYYLIAYKDHSIYSALAYWVEGETLHYVTTQNTHNQASLNLIDLEQTARLNSGHGVTFELPTR